MRKQYRCTEGTWPAYRFSLYHDGKLVDSYSKTEGEIVDERLRLESLGYTYGYTEEEVETAYKIFEHRNNNLLLRADRIEV